MVLVLPMNMPHQNQAACKKGLVDYVKCVDGSGRDARGRM